MKRKKILIVLLSILVLILINNNCYAVLQSNGGSVATKDIGSWMSQIRNMEAIGGSLGLTETFNDNLTSSSTANNLDCHMEKNTEFGALAILSASSYGNPEKIASGGTTTGNESGVVMNINKEWVAAGIINACSSYANASARYKNTYERYSIKGSSVYVYDVKYAYKNGDAITETNGWHGSGASTWISSNFYGIESWSSIYSNYVIYTAWGGAGLLRAYSGSIFSYYGFSEDEDLLNSDVLNRGLRDAYYAKTWASRAAIVIGEGF